MIQKNMGLTAYRYDENAEAWFRFVVSEAHWYEALGESPSKAEFTENEKAVVRVFSDEEIQPGDYIRRGCCFSETPDKNECLRVLSVTDNRQSRLLPHRKLVCG